MANTQIKTRIIHKHDTAANWELAVNFIPKQGEIIIYDIDSTYNYERFKIGDGATLVSALPFADDALKAEIQTLLNGKASTSSVTQLSNKVDGKVDKDGNKVLSTNDYTTTEKNKLAGIASGAEVNQNAFGNVVVGSTTIAADSKTDTLTFVAGTNITLTPDATNDKITITAKDTTYSNATTSAAGLMSADDKTKLNAAVNKLDGIASGAQVNQNAFSNITDGTTTIAADSTTDTLTLVAGSNISLALDATNDKVTISATNTTYDAAGSSLGLVKTGGDVTISSGVITVKDDSHNHTIDNIGNLQNTLDEIDAKLDYTNIAYGTCETAADVAEKVVIIDGNSKWVLDKGSIITVKFTNTNSAASPTINVNSTGAYPIYYNASEYTSASSYGGYADRHITYQFNGTHWVFISWSYDTNSDTKVTQSAATTTAGEYPVILGYSTSTSSVTNTVKKTSTLKYNPSTKILTAPTFKGDLDGTAAKATADASGNNIVNTYATKNALDAKADKSEVAALRAVIDIVAEDPNDETLDRISEIVQYTQNNKGLIDSITTSKQDKITGAATTITSSNLTASRVLVSDSSGKVAASSSITTTELGYLDGATSNLQTQITTAKNTADSKLAAADITVTVTGTGNAITAASYDDNGTITLTKGATFNNYSLPVASSTLGGVKSGGDITVASDGTVTVNDDKHNHIISNIDGLQNALDSLLPIAGGTITGNLYVGSSIDSASKVFEVKRKNSSDAAYGKLSASISSTGGSGLFGFSHFNASGVEDYTNKFYISNGSIYPETTEVIDFGSSNNKWKNIYAKYFIGNGANLQELNASNITSGTLGITRGGTGATSAAAARTALGITPANIGAVSKSGDTMTGDLKIGTTDSTTGYYLRMQRAVGDTYYVSRFYTNGDTGAASVQTMKASTTVNYMYLRENETVFKQPVTVASGGTGAANRSGAWDNIVAAGGTFTGTPVVSNSNYYGSYWFKPSMASSAMGKIYHWGGTSNNSTVLNQSYFTFRQYSYTANSTTTSDKYEDFSLPITAAGLGANGTYSILTSKNAVTVAQGGTGATTASGARTALGITPDNIGALAKSGGTLTGAIDLKPNGSSAEGGELHLCASASANTVSGIVLDNLNGAFRIFGIPSADGTTRTGTGTGLVIDPYNKTITGGYSMSTSTITFAQWTGPTWYDAAGHCYKWRSTGNSSSPYLQLMVTPKSGSETEVIRVNGSTAKVDFIRGMSTVKTGTSLPSTGTAGDVFILYT